MASPEQIRAEVDRILASQWFAGAERRGKLLRYLVEQALAGDRGSVKEAVLAAEVFDRGAEYDSRVDSLVRVEVGRLRSRLAEYYVQAGKSDPIRIEIPRGSYLPVFTAVDGAAALNGQENGAALASEPTAESPVQLSAPRSRWMGLAAIAAVALIAAGAVWWVRRAASDGPSVAILPFLNLTGDAGQEFMSDSITDELTETLAETKGMRVVARTSAFQFKGKAQDVREIGRRLNVDALLEGSVKRTGPSLELIVQLIRTGDGTHIWSKTFDAADRDLRGVETEIAQSTRHALLPSAPDSAQDLRGTGNPQAHELYLQAVYHFYKADADSLRKTLDLARQAVQLDPSFVRAHWLIVKAEHNLASFGLETPAQAEQNSAESLRAVLALDPSSAEAHTWVALQTYIQTWDWPRAEREFQIALASSGSHGNAHNLYGWGLMTRGRFAEAHAHFDAGLEIDPLVQGGARSNSVVAWLLERKYSKAKEAVNSILRLNPNSVNAYDLLAWVTLAEHDCNATRQTERKLWDLVPAVRGQVNPLFEAECGAPDRAIKRLADRDKEPWQPYFSPYGLAEVYGLLGDSNDAIGFLNQAADSHADTILYLELDPLLDKIRRDARVQSLARKIGLPEPPVR